MAKLDRFVERLFFFRVGLGAGRKQTVGPALFGHRQQVVFNVKSPARKHCRHKALGCSVECGENHAQIGSDFHGQEMPVCIHPDRQLIFFCNVGRINARGRLS